VCPAYDIAIPVVRFMSDETVWKETANEKAVTLHCLGELRRFARFLIS